MVTGKKRNSGLIHRLALLLAASLVSAGTWAESYLIDAIEFRNNEKTKPSTLLQEYEIKPGDTLSDEQIKAARQAMMDLGLFKRVSADLEDRGGPGKVLIFTIHEKRYLLVLPRLSRSGDGDWSYGARLRWDNVGGRNRRLDFGYRRKDLKNSDIQQEDRLEIEYTLPRLWGSRFNLEYVLRSEDIEIDEERDGLEGRYEQRLDSFRVILSRWLKEKGPSQGWLLEGELRYEDYQNDFLSGDPGLFFDTEVATVKLGAEFREVHDHRYSRSGKHYGYEFQVSRNTSGGDVGFERHRVFYRGYIPVTKTPHTNFNFQVRYMSSSGSIFGDPSYSLGGNSTIRGYSRESLEGESAFITNLEVVRPLFGHNTLRGALILDFGGAFEDSFDFDSSELVTGLGIGLRYKMRSFVKTDLRLDVTHGIEDGETKVYGSTSSSF